MVSQCTQKYIVGSVWLCLLVLAGFTKYPLVTCLRQNWLSAFLAHLIATHLFCWYIKYECLQSKNFRANRSVKAGVMKCRWKRWLRIISRYHVLPQSCDESVKLFFFFFFYSRQWEVPLKLSFLILLRLRERRYLTKSRNNAQVELGSSLLSLLDS